MRLDWLVKSNNFIARICYAWQGDIYLLPTEVGHQVLYYGSITYEPFKTDLKLHFLTSVTDCYSEHKGHWLVDIFYLMNEFKIRCLYKVFLYLYLTDNHTSDA